VAEDETYVELLLQSRQSWNVGDTGMTLVNGLWILIKIETVMREPGVSHRGTSLCSGFLTANLKYEDAPSGIYWVLNLKEKTYMALKGEMIRELPTPAT
jgi:hypothetical protein